MDELPLTGERTVPGHPEEQYWFARHEAVYRWILSAYRNTLPQAVVVDAGCGEGYGPALLARADTRIVIGLEFDPVVALHAHRRYPDPQIVQANLDALPLGTSSVDAVVTLQVIEHLWNLPAFLRDCYRVIRPGGVLIASTPNRQVFSPGLGRGETPTNPFHVAEFDADQVRQLLAHAGFADIEVLGLEHGNRLQEWELQNGSLVASQVEAINRRETLGDVWPRELLDFITFITAQDFTVGPVDTSPKAAQSPAQLAPQACQDLIGIGIRAVE